MERYVEEGRVEEELVEEETVDDGDAQKAGVK